MANRGRPKGQQRTGCRKKGTPNKATADVKALAQDYTLEAIRVLAAIMSSKSEPAAARVSAANALLDRAHGKVPQDALRMRGDVGVSPHHR
jgi:hypothetical protein